MLSKKLLNPVLLLVLVLQAQYTLSQDCQTELATYLGSSAANNRREVPDEPALTPVTPLAAPAASGWAADGICGAIWTQQGGSCCNQADIKARAENTVKIYTKRAESRYKRLRKGLENFLKKLNQMKTKLENLKAKNANKAAEVDPLLAKIAVLQADADKDPELIEKALASLKDCQKAMLDLRIKFWCVLCAKKAASPIDTMNLFDNGAVKIDAGSCSNLVGFCASSQHVMRKIREIHLILDKAHKSSKGHERSGGNSNRSENASAVLSDSAACANNADGCKTNAVNRKKFCAAIGVNAETEEATGDDSTTAATQTGLDQADVRLLTSVQRDNARVLQGTAAGTGLASEDATAVSLSTMNTGFTINASDFTEKGFSKVIAVGMLFTIIISLTWF